MSYKAVTLSPKWLYVACYLLFISSNGSGIKKMKASNLKSRGAFSKFCRSHHLSPLGEAKRG